MILNAELPQPQVLMVEDDEGHQKLYELALGLSGIALSSLDWENSSPQEMADEIADTIKNEDGTMEQVVVILDGVLGEDRTFGAKVAATLFERHDDLMNASGSVVLGTSLHGPETYKSVEQASWFSYTGKGVKEVRNFVKSLMNGAQR